MCSVQPKHHRFKTTVSLSVFAVHVVAHVFYLVRISCSNVCCKISCDRCFAFSPVRYFVVSHIHLVFQFSCFITASRFRLFAFLLVRFVAVGTFIFSTSSLWAQPMSFEPSAVAQFVALTSAAFPGDHLQAVEQCQRRKRLNAENQCRRRRSTKQSRRGRCQGTQQSRARSAE